MLKFLITTNSLVKKGFGKSQFHIYKILWSELCTTAVTIIICLFAKNIQIDNVFLSGVFKFVVCFTTYKGTFTGKRFIDDWDYVDYFNGYGRD